MSITIEYLLIWIFLFFSPTTPAQKGHEEVFKIVSMPTSDPFYNLKRIYNPLSIFSIMMHLSYYWKSMWNSAQLNSCRWTYQQCYARWKKQNDKYAKLSQLNCIYMWNMWIFSQIFGVISNVADPNGRRVNWNSCDHWPPKWKHKLRGQTKGNSHSSPVNVLFPRCIFDHCLTSVLKWQAGQYLAPGHHGSVYGMTKDGGNGHNLPRSSNPSWSLYFFIMWNLSFFLHSSHLNPDDETMWSASSALTPH